MDKIDVDENDLIILHALLNNDIFSATLFMDKLVKCNFDMTLGTGAPKLDLVSNTTRNSATKSFTYHATMCFHMGKYKNGVFTINTDDGTPFFSTKFDFIYTLDINEETLSTAIYKITKQASEHFETYKEKLASTKK